jgi:hypothetical protein
MTARSNLADAPPELCEYLYPWRKRVLRAPSATKRTYEAVRAVAAPPCQLSRDRCWVLGVAHWERLLGGILYAATSRIDWATLLRRSFDVDVLACARCAGRLRVLGEVTEPAAIRLVLESLSLPTEAPRAARARDPTELLAESAGDW